MLAGARNRIRNRRPDAPLTGDERKEAEKNNEATRSDASVTFVVDLAPGLMKLPACLTDAATGKDRGAYFVDVTLLQSASPTKNAADGRPRETY
jgi:hypothetical protein